MGVLDQVTDLETNQLVHSDLREILTPVISNDQLDNVITIWNQLSERYSDIEDGVRTIQRQIVDSGYSTGELLTDQNQIMMRGGGMSQFDSNYNLYTLSTLIEEFNNSPYQDFLVLLNNLSLDINKFSQLNQLLHPLESLSNWLNGQQFQVNEFVHITGQLMYNRDLLKQSSDTLRIIKQEFNSK